MEKPVTFSARHRQRIRAWMLGLGLLLLGIGAAHADGMPLNGAWQEVVAGDTPQGVMDAYHAGRMKSFDPSMLQRFPRNELGSWVVIAAQPPWNNEDRVLTVYPAPMGAISVFHGDRVHRLAMNDFSAHGHGHGRLAWRVPADLSASTPILLRVEPTQTVSAPIRFRILSWDEYLQRDTQWLVFASICFAVMLAMVMMALFFSLMLRDITYAWYAGYIVCYALIQGMQTGFVFHPLRWQWLVDSSTMVGAVAVALSVTFASLFMMRFCDLRRHARLLQVPVIAVAVGMIQLVLMRCSGIPLLVSMAQALLNPLLMIGALLLLVAGAIAALRGSRQAWFFLAGWTPLLLLTALTSAQVNGALPRIDWLNDLSLAGGAFEAMVLSLGLADRALQLRQDRDVVQVLADHDALTRLLNRRAWTERAEALLASSQAPSIAVLFLDLDHFKQLNDHHGHNTGDRALVAVATTLSAELRPGDLFGRYGGEEFVAMLDGIDAQEAMQVATRLCRRVHRLEIPVRDEQQLLSVSIGVAMRQRGDTLELLIDRADQAMYRAKLRGRNRVCMDEFTNRSAHAAGEKRLRVVETRREDR
ncbi:diguanylate cyclase [Rhodanobacter sp. UC4437_H4]|uniref:diguanylate cyclase n=2 Tax=unclassified Rhodanobacter TaxID=2621553 RepID=A0AB74V0E7_9GAMM